MTTIDKLLPFIGVAFGWLLSQYGKYSTDRKEDKRKLKKTLFNILELRWLLNKEFTFENHINIFLAKFSKQISDKFGYDNNEVEQEIKQFKPIIFELIKDKLVEPERVKEIEVKIDTTISELSEIYPIFAYELSGQYKIKERLDKSEQYFDKIKQYTEEMPFNLKDWIQPKLNKKLIDDLDIYIIEIAKKIGRKSKKEVLLTLEAPTNDDTNEMDDLINDYIEKIETMANK